MKTTTLKPLADRILVQRDETPTTAGIIALAGQQPAPERGTVVAVGPGKRNKAGDIVPLDVKVGDYVLFGRYGGATIKSEIGPLLSMKEDDILGVLEGERQTIEAGDVGTIPPGFFDVHEPSRGGFTKVIDKVLSGSVVTQ